MSKYYRHYKYDGKDPIEQAIEDLQNDVEKLDEDVANLKEWQNTIGVHDHESFVTRYYCATYGDDSNDGSLEHPFRSLIPIFDPEKSKINLVDTAIRVNFLDVGTFDAFSSHQNWLWFNGVFIRFVGPSRTTIPSSSNDLPNINFNCDAISFSNSYFASDFVKITVGTGEYDSARGEAYNRMHLNNTSLICNLTYFNESCHAPHCGSGSYRDCTFNKFACTGFQADFEHTISGNNNAIVIANSDGTRSAISCSTSMLRFNGKILIKQPLTNITPSAIVNKSCYMVIGENVEFYGTGDGLYNRGLTIGTGVLVCRRTRLEQIENLGANPTEEAGICLYVHDTTHIEV